MTTATEKAAKAVARWGPDRPREDAPKKYFVTVQRDFGGVTVFTQTCRNLAEAVRLSEEEHRVTWGYRGEALYAARADQ
jgi:hypothetical protein